MPTGFGPLELLVLTFPGEEVSRDVVQALRALVEQGSIRIVDLVFARKDARGAVAFSEAPAVGAALGLDDLTSDLIEMLSEGDIATLTSEMAPGSSAGVMLFENVWAKRFADAVRAAGGEVVLNERIPAVVVEELAASLDRLDAGAPA